MIRVSTFFISFLICSSLYGQSSFWKNVEMESITGEHVNPPESGIFILVNDMVCKLYISEISRECNEFTTENKYVLVDTYTKPFERTLKSNEIKQLIGDEFEILFLSQKSKVTVSSNSNCKNCIQSPHLLLHNNAKAKFFCYTQLYKKDSLDKKTVRKIQKFLKA